MGANMNESVIAQRFLQSLLSTAQHCGAHHVRVINLAVYDDRIDPAKFTVALETLAHGTLAEAARLHIRCCALDSLPLPNSVLTKLKSDAVHLDSMQVD